MSYLDTTDTFDDCKTSSDKKKLVDQSERNRASEEEKEMTSTKNIDNDNMDDSTENDEVAAESGDLSGETDTKAFTHRPLPKRDGLRKGKWTVSIVITAARSSNHIFYSIFCL